MDLIHTNNSPHACDQLASDERQVESDRRSERRDRNTVYDTSLNPLREIAHEHRVKVDRLGRELAALIDEREELTVRIKEVTAERDKERKLYQAAALELDEALKGEGT